MTLASDARAIFWAGVEAVDPQRAVVRTVRRRGSSVWMGARKLAPRNADLRIVAIGKAASAMADGATRAVGRRSESFVVTPRGYPGSKRGLPVTYGDHPVPGPASFRAGRGLLEFFRAGDPAAVYLFLLSGGGSAVAEVPAEGLSENDLTRTTECLLKSGAPIGAMNTLRRHLSRVKGGQLAVATGERPYATLALSDVVGDAPEEIASGPTVADPTTYRDALEAIRRYDLGGQLPSRVLRHLRSGARGDIPETPKPSWRRFRTASFELIGSNRHAVAASAQRARDLGYGVETVSAPIVGETAPAATRFARKLLRTPSAAPRALVGGGETTVTLGRRPGKGGRNQEFALAAARILSGRSALVLSAGTDGVDGPTDAAGGWTDGNSWSKAARLGLDVRRAVDRHDAYPALSRLGSLLMTGPTGTNVTDLHVGLVLSKVSRSTGGSTTRGAVPSSRRRRS